MRIGIDVQTTLGEPTGFGFYVSNLTKALAANLVGDELIQLAPKSKHDLSTPARFWWDQVQLPALARRAKIDVFHQPAFSAPVLYRGPMVVTIHDVISLLTNDIPYYSRQFYAKWMPFSYRFADHFITISEHSKQDIIKHLHLPTERVSVIYEAVDKMYQTSLSPGAVAAVKNKYGIAAPYLLHVGTINPRKNLEFLVKVFAAVRKESKAAIQLVITGKKGWHYHQLFHLVNDLGIADHVIFTGYLEEKDKPALYHGATVFVFPSLYEGFGLPPLEAMSCGIPTISSNTSSLPEVVGDGAISLCPDDEKGWAEAILAVLKSVSLQKKLSAQGLKQAAKFSWERCAKETLEVYHRVATQQRVI